MSVDEFWRCPACRGPLSAQPDALWCATCRAAYPCFDGIPDLRLAGASWVDQQHDREQALELLEHTEGATAEEMARYVFGLRTESDASWAEMRTRQFVEGPGRLGRELDAWLAPTAAAGRFLDLGCGNGTLLSAAAVRGMEGIGVDVRLVWLLVAKRLIESHGGTARLAAAMAEALPIADGALSGVISLDVVEHVGDVPQYLREIDRVLAPRGSVALATPNRYSLTAEPHVFVWGVGLVPRRWQERYVRARSGRPYDFVQLLSVPEMRRLLSRHTHLVPTLLVPPVSDEELARFPFRRRFAARIYNRLSRNRLTTRFFLAIGPFFRVVGRKGDS